MDQTTHERRFADWQAIVTNCLSRPTGQSKKEWLAEHDVPGILWTGLRAFAEWYKEYYG